MLKLTAPASACSPSPSDDFRYSSLFAVKEETRWVLTLVATKSLDRCQPEVEKEANRDVSGNQRGLKAGRPMASAHHKQLFSESAFACR